MSRVEGETESAIPREPKLLSCFYGTHSRIQQHFHTASDSFTTRMKIDPKFRVKKNQGNAAKTHSSTKLTLSLIGGGGTQA